MTFFLIWVKCLTRGKPPGQYHPPVYQMLAHNGHKAGRQEIIQTVIFRVNDLK